MYTTGTTIDLDIVIKASRALGTTIDNIHAEVKSASKKVISNPDTFTDAIVDTDGSLVFTAVPIEDGLNIIRVYSATAGLDVDNTETTMVYSGTIKKVANATQIDGLIN